MTKTVVFLYFLKALRLITNILGLSVVSRYFGISSDRDFWILALALIGSFELFVFGPINETIRSTFIKTKDSSGVDASVSGLVGYLIFVLISVLILFCLVLTNFKFYLNIFCNLLNFGNASNYYSVFLIIIPYIIINQLNTILTSVLNIYNQINSLEFFYLLSSVLNILLIILFAERYGLMSLIYSLYLSVVLLCIYLVFKVYKISLFSFKLKREKIFKGFMAYILPSLPLYITYGFGQIASLVEKSYVSSRGEGIISIVDYSRKIGDTLILLNTSVILTVAMPLLSRIFANSSINEFKKKITEQIKYGILFVTCMLSFLVPFLSSITRLIFANNSISIDVLNEIQVLTVFYTACVFPVFIYSYCGYCLIAMGRSRSYAFYTTLNQIIILLVIWLFSSKFSIYFFPVIMFIMHLFTGIFMLPLISKNFKHSILQIFKALVLILITCLISDLLKSITRDFPIAIQIVFNFILATTSLFVSLRLLGYSSLIHFKNICAEKLKF